ncbi:tyrosine-type recombinase/integrase [Streptomyces sp. NPDC001914]|uniref:tyrosine-type recombinase/integrase n=1 Tax=Streptomyces sp. NPDC001914 TaxID=3364623 RepID=UPI00368FC9DA
MSGTWTRSEPGSADRCGIWSSRRRRVLRQGAAWLAERHPAGPVPGAEHFDDHTRPGAPLFPSERKNADGSSRRVGDDALRNGLKDAAKAHLPGWGKKLGPHVLRHFCASQLYGNGLDLLAIQEVLGHSWIATTMRYIHVQQTRAEDA